MIASLFLPDRHLLVSLTSRKGIHKLYQSNLLIFCGSRLNMTAPAGVSGARQAGECGGMEPS
jgi:hypothetical protein